MYLAKKIEAPVGRPLRVCRICRISTAHQDERSLDEQDFQAEEELSSCYTGPVEWLDIRSQGSGDLLDTEAHHELERVIKERQADLVLLEDLGRIARRIDTHAFCELCVLHGVRLISIREQVDTVIEGWEDVSILSLWHHERSNRETSKRIKRTKRGRFVTHGPIHQVIFGYVKPSGTKNDSDVCKDPDLEEFSLGIIERLEDDWTYADVSDWLNRHDVPVGPNCDRGIPKDQSRWTGVMVRRWIKNEILHGERYHNKTETHRVDRNGTRRQKRSEADRVLSRSVPHLAMISKERHEVLLAKLAMRNRGSGRTPKEAYGTRARSDFPGTALNCGICGRTFIYGARGDCDSLACSGIRNHLCWVGNSVNMDVVDRKLRGAAYARLEALAESSGVLAESVRDAVASQNVERDREIKRLRKALQAKTLETDNVLNQIAAGEAPPIVNEFLSKLESERKTLQALLIDAERIPDVPDFPDDDTLLRIAREELFELDRTNPEYSHAMRRLLPQIEVFPVLPIDADEIGSRIKFRARVSMDLLALPSVGTHGGLISCPTETLIVDLFDPPQRIVLAPKVKELQLKGLKQREIRDAIGTHLPTVQNAAALLRKLEAKGTEDPYVPVLEPFDTRKNANHLHPRYRFTPQEGYPKRLID